MIPFFTRCYQTEPGASSRPHHAEQHCALVALPVHRNVSTIIAPQEILLTWNSAELGNRVQEPMKSGVRAHLARGSTPKLLSESASRIDQSEAVPGHARCQTGAAGERLPRISLQTIKSHLACLAPPNNPGVVPVSRRWFWTLCELRPITLVAAPPTTGGSRRYSLACLAHDPAWLA